MNLHGQINQLSRQQVVILLEGVCIACFDDEPTQDLREALAVNIKDGTISGVEKALRLTTKVANPPRKGQR